MIKYLIFLLLLSISVSATETNSTVNAKQESVELLKYRMAQLEADYQEVDKLKENYATISSLEYYVNFYSILITVIVLILAFKTASDAKKEARSVLLDETKELKREYLETIEEIKKRSNEVLNNFMNESDVDIILNDKEVIEEEYHTIKGRDEKSYDYQDYMIVGLYHYNKNEYKESQKYFLEAQKNTSVLFEQAKSMIFVEKSISFQNLSKTSLKSETKYYDKIIELANKNLNDLALLKIAYQAYVYKIGRYVLLGKYKESILLLNEAMFKHDLPLTYYARGLYTKLLVLKKLKEITAEDEEKYVEELQRIKLFRDNKFKETILTRMDTSFRYNQNVEVDVKLILEIFSNKFSYKDIYMSAIAEMYAILNDISQDIHEDEIKLKYAKWFEDYYHIDYSYDFFTLKKWISDEKNTTKMALFSEYIEKFSKS